MLSCAGCQANGERRRRPWAVGSALGLLLLFSGALRGEELEDLMDGIAPAASGSGGLEERQLHPDDGDIGPSGAAARAGGRAGQAPLPGGPRVRFRVDAMPADGKPLKLSERAAAFAPVVIAEAGVTPWVSLNNPRSLIISVPAADGWTEFGGAVPGSTNIPMRRFPWREADAGLQKIIFDPQLPNLRTLRDIERANYQLTLEQTHGRLWPLARPPLLLGNSWGKTDGQAAEYMVKTLRLMGMNCVETISDQAKVADLYGWTIWGGTYRAPVRLPYDPEAVRAWQDGNYSNYPLFKLWGPAVSVFQLSDEPDEIGIKVDEPGAEDGFRRWLAERKVAPGVFGRKSLEEVKLLAANPQGAEATPENRARYYWSRRYQGWLTPKAYALAGAAVKRHAPNPAVEPYVALSGHSMYLRGKGRMPMDMFDLAAYPEVMPGISDWMSPNVVFTGEEWRFLTHETVAYSAAIFNSGARGYGADFGRPPLSRSMMHCVYPSCFRAYAMLANQIKYITYYNYGPTYGAQCEKRAAAWAGLPGPHKVVQQVNNQAALADDLLGHGVLRPSRVALLYARSTEYYGWAQLDATARRALFFALSHEYYRPDLLTEEQIEAGALEHYDALYVAEQWVARSAQDRIAAWVRNGGLLWAGGLALRFDEYQEPCDLLAREAGLQRTWGAPDTNTLAAPVKGEADFEPHHVSRKWTCGNVAGPDARVRARYADGTPAWLEKVLGKGRVVYVLHQAGSDYLRHRWPQGDLVLWTGAEAEGCRGLLTAPLREAKVERELTVSVPVMMATPLSTDAGTAIVLYNMNRATNENVIIRLKSAAAPHSVQVIRPGARALEDLPYTFADGAVAMTLPRLPGTNEGLIIAVRLQPPPPDGRVESMRRKAEAALAAAGDGQALSAGAWFAGFFPEWGLGPKLAPLLKHEHWAVRRSAAEALGRLNPAGAGEALRTALDRETDSHVLADLLIALDRVGHRDVPALARKLADHYEPVVQKEARAILERRGSGAR